MLNASDNERLTRVGPGTPAGNWMRRHWLPVAVSDAFDGMRSHWQTAETFLFQDRIDTATDFGRRLVEFSGKPTRIRVLGEDLVLFRDGSGRLGLFEHLCPHRGASFEFGRVKPDGLECIYHGWKFDVNGRCIAQPTEPPGREFGDKIHNVAYPVRELGGLVWAYLGPGEPPELPLIDVLVDENCFRTVEMQGLWPANYLQIIEQVPDVIHTSTLHGYDGSEMKDIWNRLPEFSWEEGPHGVISRQSRGGHQRSSCQLMPFFTRLVPPWSRTDIPLPQRQAFIVWLPVDDTHTLIFEVVATRLVDGKVPELPAGLTYALAREIQVVLDQDYKALVSQGPIRDRTLETLGTSDRGVTLLRKMMLRDIKAVEDGRDPMNVRRAPEAKGRLDFTEISRDSSMAAWA